MNLIRDEEMHGIMMIPLFHQYGVHYCHVEGCLNKASTLLIDTDVTPGAIGICEGHYNTAKQSGKWQLSLDMNKDQTYKPIE